MATSASPTQPATRHHANPQLNVVADGDRPVHDWYRFVLSYPPHLVRDYLGKFEMGSGAIILDPFCGTGTTIVESKKLGIGGIGIEANPMAHFASSVKTDWTVSGKKLRTAATSVAERATEILHETGYVDDCDAPLFNFRSKSDEPKAVLRGLPEQANELILEDSISPLPLHKSLCLLQALDEADEVTKRLGHLALAKGLVGEIGNLHFGPEVGVGAKKPDAAVIGIWHELMERMASDLDAVSDRKHIPSEVYHADARRIASRISLASIDAIITSPPYPNEKDYTRTTRLESVLLGFMSNRADLKALKQNLLRSNTRNVFKGDEDDAWVIHHPQIQALADEIESRRILLNKTSGFEKNYARVTRMYFGGMARHFAELRPLLKPGAKLAYVVGDQASFFRVMIRTGQLLAEVAEELGYRVVGIDLFRTRLATATREQLREEVVLLEWPGGR